MGARLLFLLLGFLGCLTLSAFAHVGEPEQIFATFNEEGGIDITWLVAGDGASVQGQARVWTQRPHKHARWDDATAVVVEGWHLGQDTPMEGSKLESMTAFRVTLDASLAAKAKDGVIAYAVEMVGALEEVVCASRLTALRIPGDATQTDATFRFFVLGDVDERPVSYDLARKMAGEVPMDGWLLPGDMAYARPGRDRWVRWSRMVSPILSRAPLAFSIGNHDLESEGSYELRLPSMGTGAGPGGRGMWWSVPVGPMRVVSLTSGTDSLKPPNAELARYAAVREAQLQWLDASLARFNTPAERSRRPWIVVLLHAPIFTTGPHKVIMQMRTDLHPLMVRHRVDLVVCGHNHVVERAEADGVVYLTVGTGGFGGHVTTPPSPLDPPLVFAEPDHFYGYGTLHVSRTRLSFRFLPLYEEPTRDLGRSGKGTIVMDTDVHLKDAAFQLRKAPPSTVTASEEEEEEEEEEGVRPVHPRIGARSAGSGWMLWLGVVLCSLVIVVVWQLRRRAPASSARGRRDHGRRHHLAPAPGGGVRISV